MSAKEILSEQFDKLHENTAEVYVQVGRIEQCVDDMERIFENRSITSDGIVFSKYQYDTLAGYLRSIKTACSRT
jgi:hypothetical protein